MDSSKSPTMRMMEAIWEGATKVNHAGWSTLNQALRRGLEVAVIRNP